MEDSRSGKAPDNLACLDQHSSCLAAGESFDDDSNLTSQLIVPLNSPGIGVSLAKAFAAKHFDSIVLCSRSSEKLQDEKRQVAAAAKEAGRDVDVHTFVVDLGIRKSIQKATSEIDKLGGSLGCVYHNAARIRPSEVLTTDVDELEEDLRVGHSCSLSRRH